MNWILMASFIACANPVVGDWVSADSMDGYFDEMEIEEDLQGTATLHFYSGSTLYYADFEVEVIPDNDGLLKSMGSEYEIDFECDGDCGDLDFTMDCEMNDDSDEMECDGNDLWSEFDFDWEID